MRSVLLLVLSAAALAGADVRAGIARLDLDPPTGIEMSGYGDRKGKAAGVLDPPQARVLVLSDGQRTIALVTLDLIFSFDAPEMARIRSEVKARGVDEVHFHASHTHSGPAYWSSRAALEKAISRVVLGIATASGVMVPVNVGTGFGSTFLGHNRRQGRIEGGNRMLWRDETKIPNGPVDPTVGVIRIDRKDGKPLAVLVNYACHPVVLGPDNLRYSADYPGEMRIAMEEALGDAVTAFFLQGAPGDINPFFDKTPLAQDAVALMKQTGRQLAQEAVRVARTIKTTAPERPAIQTRTVLVPVRSRWDVPKWRAALTAKGVDLNDPRVSRLLYERADLPVTTLLLNHEIALVTLPGEPFVEFQIDLRARSPLPATFVLGYTDGSFAYFPTVAAAARGGYGAASATWVEVGAGERMVDVGLRSLYELLGQLSNKPASEK